MTDSIRRIVRVGLLAGICLLLASCEPPRVYGSVGYSSYGGGGYGGYYGGYGGMGTSVSIGGRIF
jgi:hypothetical protein